MSTVLLRNTNTHRVYYGDGKSYAQAGAIFEGSHDDADRPGIVKVTGAEAKAAERERRGEGPDPGNEAQESAVAVHELTRQAALASTAPLRGEAPFQPGALTTASAGASALKGSDTGEAPDVDAIGELSNDELVVLAREVLSEVVERGLDHEVEDDDDETVTAADLVDAYNHAGLVSLAATEDVEIGKRDSKAVIAAKIVSARDADE